MKSIFKKLVYVNPVVKIVVYVEKNLNCVAREQTKKYEK